ncbi:hypothetical protein EDEG_01372 [Edhazardia aedis USNM 41457]|uniref:Uncharacterized protein n=1 Tax=Edhazardia aedis (strain USNM 41457) TaxID=1003232 RepID=J9D9C6_EDHAE|nr:hypothetical protein EDEG_01372 [Edhazardia aedis USNM 41457]|eukprot:EJW04381.1 hypothetical protein EDEG_01372 [Edhazardia aedis USNM 41457]
MRNLNYRQNFMSVHDYSHAMDSTRSNSRADQNNIYNQSFLEHAYAHPIEIQDLGNREIRMETIQTIHNSPINFNYFNSFDSDRSNFRRDLLQNLSNNSNIETNFSTTTSSSYCGDLPNPDTIHLYSEIVAQPRPHLNFPPTPNLYHENIYETVPVRTIRSGTASNDPNSFYTYIIDEGEKNMFTKICGCFKNFILSTYIFVILYIPNIYVTYCYLSEKFSTRYLFSIDIVNTILILCKIKYDFFLKKLSKRTSDNKRLKKFYNIGVFAHVFILILVAVSYAYMFFQLYEVFLSY